MWWRSGGGEEKARTDGKINYPAPRVSDAGMAFIPHLHDFEEAPNQLSRLNANGVTTEESLKVILYAPGAISNRSVLNSMKPTLCRIKRQLITPTQSLANPIIRNIIKQRQPNPTVRLLSRKNPILNISVTGT